jgi:signal peptidase II
MKNKQILFYILIIIILFLDQITKILSINKNLTLIPRLLYVKYAENPGVIFGLFKYNIIFLYVIPIAIIIFLFIYFYKNKISSLITIGSSFIISGLLSNIIDRIRLGYVIDFIFIPIIPKYNISLFNFADLFLIIGVILLIYYNLKK